MSDLKTKAEIVEFAYQGCSVEVAITLADHVDALWQRLLALENGPNADIVRKLPGAAVDLAFHAPDTRRPNVSVENRPLSAGRSDADKGQQSALPDAQDLVIEEQKKWLTDRFGVVEVQTDDTLPAIVVRFFRERETAILSRQKMEVELVEVRSEVRAQGHMLNSQAEELVETRESLDLEIEEHHKKCTALDALTKRVRELEERICDHPDCSHPHEVHPDCEFYIPKPD